MKSLLITKDLWNIVIDAPNLATELKAEEKLKQLKSLAEMNMAVEENQLVYTRHCQTGREAWIALKDQHQHGGLGARIRLMKSLFSEVIESRVDARAS